MQINPYAIPPFIGALLILSLGSFVLMRNRKSPTNASFAFISLAVFMWLLSEALLVTSNLGKFAFLFSKIVYIGVTAIPISCYIFSLTLSKIKISKTLSKTIFLLYILTLLIVFKTDWIVAGAKLHFWGYYPVIGHLHIYYLILWLALYIRSGYILYINGYKNTTSFTKEEISRIRYGFWLMVLGAVGISDFMPKYGIEYYPLGFLLIPFWYVVISYAVTKRQLFDIDIVIRKGVVYSILVAFITAIYFILVILISRAFQNIVGYQSFIINLFIIFTIAILFNPLRNKIQQFLDKRFFKGTLESLAREKERLQQELFQTEKLAYVGGLASSIAHEIKNPLTAIKTFLEYLPQRYQEADFKKRFEDLIPKEIERIENVVSQLLDLAKPQQATFREVNIVNVIDSTLSLLENNLKTKSINVKKDYQIDEAIIQGDEEQLRQVFLNLFLNSLQAMNEGGVLTINISISVNSRSEKLAEIRVQDNGCGISEENLKKLFTPFFTTKKDGVGLGLVITQEIIKQHKGDINIESKIGEGTKFIINLPLKES